jgi:lipopolysaccharide transport system permease protein
MKFIDTIFTAFNLENYIDLLIVLTHKEIKVRYKSSVLGYLWSVANPLAIAFVFYLAFKIVMRIQIEAYSLFLITRLFPWQWFSNWVLLSP